MTSFKFAFFSLSGLVFAFLTHAGMQSASTDSVWRAAKPMTIASTVGDVKELLENLDAMPVRPVSICLLACKQVSLSRSWADLLVITCGLPEDQSNIIKKAFEASLKLDGAPLEDECDSLIQSNSTPIHYASGLVKDLAKRTAEVVIRLDAIRLQAEAGQAIDTAAINTQLNTLSAILVRVGWYLSYVAQADVLWDMLGDNRDRLIQISANLIIMSAAYLRLSEVEAWTTKGFLDTFYPLAATQEGVAE